MLKLIQLKRAINPNLVLDNIDTNVCCYSLKRCSKNYTNPPIRITRDYDNASINIYLLPNGELDEEGLKNYCKTYLQGGYLNLNGKALSNCATTTSNPILTPTAGITIESKIYRYNTTSTIILASKQEVGVSRSYRFQIIGNALYFIVTQNGVYSATNEITGSIPNQTGLMWFRAKYICATTTATIEYSLNGTDWVLINTVNTFDVTSIYSATTPLVLGAYYNTGATLYGSSNVRLYRTKIYNETDTLVYDADFETAPANETSFVESASGLTVNISASQSAAFVNLWRDQGKYKLSLSLTTKANMPRIVDTNGDVEKKDGHIAMRFRYPGSTAVSYLQNLNMSSGITSNEFDILLVGATSAVSGVEPTMLEFSLSGASSQRNAIGFSMDLTKARCYNTAIDLPYSAGALVARKVSVKSGSISHSVNDSSLLSISATRNEMPIQLRVGDDLTSGNDLTGYISELIILQSSSTSQRDWVQDYLMRRYVSQGLYSDGVDGANKYATLADRAEYQLTGDMSIVAKIKTSDLIKIDARGQICSLINKTTPTNSQYSFNVAFGVDRSLIAVLGGGNSQSIPIPLTASTYTYIKINRNITTGAKFAYSTNGVNWTQLALVSTNFTGAMQETIGDPIRILGAEYLTTRNCPVTLQEIKVYNGLIDLLTNEELSATKVIDMDFTTPTYGQTTGITNSVFGDSLTLSNVQII